MNNIIQGFPTPQKDYYKVYVRSITFNQAPYIEDCLNGVAMQETNFPFVHHVIDDASTDGEQDVIKAWMEKYCDMEHAEYYDNDICTIIIAKNKKNPNCTLAAYFLKKNMYGNPKKRELFTPWCEVCPYEALCEGDDYWIDHNKLQKQVDFLDGHHDYVLCHSSCKIYFQDQGTWAKNGSFEKCCLIKEPKCIDFITGYRIHYATALLRTDAYIKALNMDPFLFSGYFQLGDTQTWWQMSKLGKIHYIPEEMTVYRQVANSATHLKSKAKFRHSLSVAELEYYLVEKDNLTEYIEKFKKILHKSYVQYLVFDPVFKSKVYPNLSISLMEKFFLKTGIERILMSNFAVRIARRLDMLKHRIGL